MSEENGYRYTCNEYREEMRLMALKRKLEQLDTGLIALDLDFGADLRKACDRIMDAARSGDFDAVGTMQILYRWGWIPANYFESCLGQTGSYCGPNLFDKIANTIFVG